MQKLFFLSKALTTLGHHREAKAIHNLIKTAYINEARIEVDLSSDRISATLKGRLPSGNSADFGNCWAMNLSDRAILVSNPSASIWEFHRQIDRPEYSGLGYMNELLTTIVSQVQNNGGVAFNGIGIEMVGSMVSEHGMSHTLEKLGKSLSRSPVIVFYQPQKKLHLIFEPSDRNLAKEEFLAGYGVELSDDYLDHLFSTPYKRIDISELNPKNLRNIPNTIISAFKITATSAKTSIPVSLSHEGYKEDTSDKFFDNLIYQVYNLTELSYNLLNQYYNLLKKIFPDKSIERSFFDKIDQGLTPRDILKEFINDSSITFNQEAYFEVEPQIEDLSEKINKINGEIFQLQAEIKNIENEQAKMNNEYKDRAEYVGQIRNRYNY